MYHIAKCFYSMLGYGWCTQKTQQNEGRLSNYTLKDFFNAVFHVFLYVDCGNFIYSSVSEIPKQSISVLLYLLDRVNSFYDFNDVVFIYASDYCKVSNGNSD